MSRAARTVWRAWLCETAMETIIEAASRMHPRETGGVLVGVLVGTRPWVTNAAEVETGNSSGSYYELPAEARERVVSRLRREDGRLGYLGDWHSHPADLEPSHTDLESVARVARDPEAGSERPLLLLARRVDGQYRLDARQASGVGMRPLRLIATGPLPPLQDSGKRLGRSFVLTAHRRWRRGAG